ncbi:hypothetical protein [Lysinibacillus sp. NPDC093692]|uniref:hypothetical protein n=1 Tax=Lysinibacillus sp. NPDC093692 TaxID=3390578 RepID=UPI003CFEEBBA
MKKYLEKYAMGMIIATILLFIEEGPDLPLHLPIWKQLIVSFIILPSMWYLLERTNDNHSDIDTPYFTWQKFRLLLSLLLGIIATFIVADMLGYIQYVK